MESSSLMSQSMAHSSLIKAKSQTSDRGNNQYIVKMKRTQSTQWSPWKEIKTPSTQVNCRYHHSSVVHDGKLYIYGGLDNDIGVLSDFKMFDNGQGLKNKWKDLSVVNGPGTRHSHSSVIHNDTIYIFGGKVDRFNSTNTLHAYSLKQKKWRLIQTCGQGDKIKQKHEQTTKQTNKKQPIKKNNSINKKNQQLKNIIENQDKPLPIDSHQAVIMNDQMIIYGGFSNNQFINNIYSLNLNTYVWKKIYPVPKQNNDTKTDFRHNAEKLQQPQPRSDFSMVVYHDKLFIYAGKNLNKNFNDLWQFDFKTLKFTKLNSQVEGKILQNRSGHSAVIYKKYMLVFGGITTVTHQRDDFICYDLQTNKWTIIWNNSEQKWMIQQKYKKKCSQKKISSTKNKSPDCNTLRHKQQQQQNQKPRKYRRPLAEQKQQKTVPSRITNKQRNNKKQNQRKILLINQLQTAVKPWQHTTPQQYSPLIQSLTNSIMITSNAHGSVSTRDNMNKTQEQFSELQKLSKDKKIKARDGHTAHIVNNEMLIFGGDRHIIAINDVVYINLQLIMETIERQFKQEQDEQGNQAQAGNNNNRHGLGNDVIIQHNPHFSNTTSSRTTSKQ